MRASRFLKARLFEYPIQYNKDWNLIAADIMSTAKPRLNTQSNTTRIETHSGLFQAGYYRGFEYPIQYNKDWNTELTGRSCKDSLVWIPNPIQQGLKHTIITVNQPEVWEFEYPIQYNKDWNGHWCGHACLPPPSLNTQSNTTRIETAAFNAQGRGREAGLNTQSNTTRIETVCVHRWGG